MIAIIDYGIGNLASVFNMFKKIGIKEVLVTNKIADIEKADKLLIPGVGSFDRGMSNLHASNLIEVLNHKAIEQKVPVLGICLGMQLLGKGSEEGQMQGLGWIDAHTVKFKPEPSLKLRVPNMGWEYVKVQKENPLLAMDSKSRFYFVHSYHVVCEQEEQSIAQADFDGPFTCMVNKENVYGTQFHPEKSLKFGMKLLENFAKI